ncbi:MAG TPA: hypothetical protein VMU14_22800 [Acidimicrobiales bacterium]|nr:hypothetical protein [Acidimicrobiales bacterium]
MSWAWMVPAALTAAGVAIAALLARRVAATADALRRDISGLAAVRPALVEVRDEMSATGAELRRLRTR